MVKVLGVRKRFEAPNRRVSVNVRQFFFQLSLSLFLSFLAHITFNYENVSLFSRLTQNHLLIYGLGIVIWNGCGVNQIPSFDSKRTKKKNCFFLLQYHWNVVDWMINCIVTGLFWISLVLAVSYSFSIKQIFTRWFAVLLFHHFFSLQFFLLFQL